MDSNAVFTAAVQFLLVLLAIAVHESAHAWMADLCGDPTGRTAGRVTLNPLPHLEPFGSVLLPALQIAFTMIPFGWGRPAPVMPASFRRPGWDDIRVAAAGPVANLLLSSVAVVGVAVGVAVLGPEARQAAYLTLLRQPGAAGHLAGFPLMFTLVQAALINAFIAVFNLIPLPPLDGGQIALQLLPSDWGAKLAALRPYGFIIGVGLAVLGVVPILLAPLYMILAIILNAALFPS
ncbi:MAG TPA: site-2 protease family protein [Thermoanaerobaculia bacterium]|jgi:Zn-dependent protease|nr:site-2 protease family protein [Thermoanaerobaculia bacterium]